MADNVDLECFRGETMELTVTITKDEMPYSLADSILYMTGRRNAASPIVFQCSSGAEGGVTIVGDPANGVAFVKLRPTDTTVLPNQETTIAYDIVAVSDTDRYVVAYGNLKVKPSEY